MDDQQSMKEILRLTDGDGCASGRSSGYLALLDLYKDATNVNHAANQGAAAFTPAMLPKLWHSHPCPYRTPIYKEAWYRGFYSCATWYLIDRVATLGRTWSPDLGRMFEWYQREHPESDWKRVPAGMPT